MPEEEMVQGNGNSLGFGGENSRSGHQFEQIEWRVL